MLLPAVIAVEKAKAGSYVTLSNASVQMFRGSMRLEAGQVEEASGSFKPKVRMQPQPRFIPQLNSSQMSPQERLVVSASGAVSKQHMAAAALDMYTGCCSSSSQHLGLALTCTPTPCPLAD